MDILLGSGIFLILLKISYQLGTFKTEILNLKEEVKQIKQKIKL